MAGDPAASLDGQLRAFLHAGAAKPFDWVSCNCGFWVCDWVKSRRGVDPVAHLRGRFHRQSSFHRHVFNAGGNEMFSRKIASLAGLKETDKPERGDVGLIATASGPTMAIALGDGRWAAKSLRGVTIAEFPMIAAWSV